MSSPRFTGELEGGKQEGTNLFQLCVFLRTVKGYASKDPRCTVPSNLNAEVQRRNKEKLKRLCDLASLHQGLQESDEPTKRGGDVAEKKKTEDVSMNE